jgi:hypothetical protein
VGARSFTSAAAATTSSSVGSAKVLVKIGSGGEWLFPVDVEALMAMDGMALLEALAGSPRFRNDLKDVPLGQCKVFLLQQGVAGAKPTAAEEAGAIQLRSAFTIGEALLAAGGTGVKVAGHRCGNFFLRVHLPGSSQPPGERRPSAPLLPVARSP